MYVKRSKKIQIPALISILFVFAFDNYLGDPSFTDLFNSISAATVIFTILFPVANGLANYQYRSIKCA